MPSLTIMQRHPTNINQVAVGNFMMTGGNLGTVGSQNGMSQGRRQNFNPAIQRLQRCSGIKAHAIAPGALLFRQHLLLG